MSQPAKLQIGFAAAAAVVLIALIVTVVFVVGGGEDDRSFGPPSSWNAALRDEVEKQHQAIEQAMNAREFEQAQRLALAHLERFPKDPQGRAMLSQVLYAMGQTDAALAEARISLRQDDTQEKVLWFAAALSYRKGLLDEAIGYYARAQELNPNAPQYPLSLANACLKANRPDEARVHALRALQLSSDLHQAYALLAEAAARQGHLDSALEQIDRALYLCQPDTAHHRQYTLRKAALQRRANKPALALDTLRTLDEAVRDTPDVAEQIAKTHLMLSQPKQAAEVWQHVYQRKPSAAAAAEVGLCLHRAGDIAGAKQWLTLAQMHLPDHPRVQALRALLEKMDTPG